MKKILTVNGMKCEHCKASVEKALSEIKGVSSAKVDLKKKTATVSLNEDVADAVLSEAVTNTGFEVEKIEVKKGIFDK